MEELNNEVSNVEQQVSWSWNANDTFYHYTIQIALQGPLYNTPPTRVTLGEPTFYTFPYKTWRVVYVRNRTLAQLEERPAIRVTLLAAPTFLRRNTLARPEHAQVLFSWAKGSVFFFFTYNRSLKLTRRGEWPFYLGHLSSHIRGPSRVVQIHVSRFSVKVILNPSDERILYCRWKLSTKRWKKQKNKSQDIPRLPRKRRYYSLAYKSMLIMLCMNSQCALKAIF